MKNIIFLLFILISAKSFGDANLTIVAVGEATVENQKIVISRPSLNGDFTIRETRKFKEYLELLANDFSFYKRYFNVERAFQKKFEDEFGNPNFTHWQGQKASILIHNKISRKNKKSLEVEVIAFNVKNKEILYQGGHVLQLKNVRAEGHKIADMIYSMMTGRESVFNSKIVFVSDRDSRARRNKPKELYIMDFDGRNVQQLTKHGATVISPAISHDKSKIAYSLIKRRKGYKNIDLYLMDLKTRKSKPISTKRGINSGAVFMPGDEEIIYTVSFPGNTEIYRMNLQTRKRTRVTKHFSEDVDPSVNDDGSLMTWLSSRPGKAMIYTGDPRGVEKNVKRISFVGKFNATPRFSPDGKYIAFSSWLDERFDIFRINSNGLGLVRLTRNFGSNEDPTFSKDAEFIAFTSQRVLSRKKATQNIYIMDRDGEILGAVTEKMGNCTSPRWSK